MAEGTVIPGKVRYAADGQVAECPSPPKPLYNDPALQIKRIDIWLRKWDRHTVIGGLSLEYRHPFSKKVVGKYSKGNCSGTGEHFYVELEPDEVIRKVVLGSGYLIDRLGFETNKGRVLGPYGGGDGGSHEEDAPAGSFAYLLDINCDNVVTKGEDAIFNLMLRWVSFE